MQRVEAQRCSAEDALLGSVMVLSPPVPQFPHSCDPELIIPFASALRPGFIFAELPGRGEEGFHIVQSKSVLNERE